MNNMEHDNSMALGGEEDPELAAKLALLEQIMGSAEEGMAGDLKSKYAPPEEVPAEEPLPLEGEGLEGELPPEGLEGEGEADPAQLEQLLALLGE